MVMRRPLKSIYVGSNPTLGTKTGLDEKLARE